MFGHLPNVFKSYIVRTFGEPRWAEIIKKSGCEEKFDSDAANVDKFLERIGECAESVLKIKREDFFSNVGEEYLQCLRKNGHNQLLRVLGSSFFQFVQNIDFVHSVAKVHQTRLPSFRCDASSSESQILLHYYSHHDQLSKLVEGLLKAVAKEYFAKKLDISIVKEGMEKMGGAKGGSRHHVVYGISVTDFPKMSSAPPTLIAQTRKHAELQIEAADVEEQKSKIEQIRTELGEDALPVNKARTAKVMWKATIRMNMLYSRMNPTIPRTLSVTPQAFCEVFPYHFVFDEEMGLMQAGVQIQAIIPAFRFEKEKINKYLDLLHPPALALTYDNVLRFIECPHVMKTKVNKLSKTSKAVLLRGQMMPLTDKRLVLFLCSPYVETLDDLEDRGFHISDLPTHDVTKYFLRSTLSSGDSWMKAFHDRTHQARPGEQPQGAVERVKRQPPALGNDTNKDNSTNSRPDHTSAAHFSSLALLPRGIAQKIQNGESVDGKMYKNVSILFCDLVHFNNIVKVCKPNEAVSLLNSLHQEFDRLAKVHDTFRVEVIGDAYVAVSGIPGPLRSHAARVANMALAMLLVSHDTDSPYKHADFGKRAVIRIGAHTGDVIGGLLGTKVRRFTVMGDAVVTASRLESHGLPDHIHVSPAFFKELPSKTFELTERGSVGIRGFGRIFTYFLRSNKDASPDMLLGRTTASPENHQLSVKSKAKNRITPSRESSICKESVCEFPYKE